MIGQRRNWPLVVAIQVLLGFAAPLSAAPPTITDFNVGIVGYLQAGHWAPVEFTLEAEDGSFVGQIDLEAIDGDGVPYRIPASDQPIRIESGATHRLVFHFKPAALDNELRLTFTETDGRTSTHTLPFDEHRHRYGVKRAFPANDRLFVSVGPSLGIVDAFSDAIDADGPATRAVEFADFTALPTDALGLDAVDALFIATSDPALNAAWTADPERAQAVATWVRRGGRLVLSIGREAETVLATSHPLAQFVPGRYQSQVALRDTVAWEAYVGARRPLPAIGEGERLRVPLVLDFQGKVEAPLTLSPGQPPLVARAPFGLGEVVYIAADLDQAPFADWSGRGNLLRRAVRLGLIGDADQPRAAATRIAPQFDLVEQLRHSMEVFPGVRLAPFHWVAILALAYIALIGPADYNLLRRFLVRMEWTWVTFPVLVAATAYGAYQLANSLKGRQAHVHQIDVVDIDAAGNVRGTAIVNIFSPTTAAYDLAIQPRPAFAGARNDLRVRLSGFALQPLALAGESERTAVIPISADPYSYSPSLNRLTSLPIHIWSTKSIAADWYAVGPPPVVSNLSRNASGRLQGELRLTTDLPLEDCWLVDGQYVARLGDLKPGESIPAAPRDGVWSSLSSQLSYQRRVQKVPGKDDLGVVGTQWNPETTDVREILRQILFYDAAGGPAYTRAWNGALRKLDLSERRDLNQAILVGFASNTILAPTTIYNHNQPLEAATIQQQTVLRAFLPISPSPVPLKPEA